MREDSTFSDEELTAFIDGEADASLRAGIEASLKEDKYLQKRVEALTINIDALRQGFDMLLRTAPAAPDSVMTPSPYSASQVASKTLAHVQNTPVEDGGEISSPVKATRSKVSWLATTAAAILCLFVGGFAGLNLNHYQNEQGPVAVTDAWENYAAIYHALYVKETLAHVSNDAAPTLVALQRTSNALEKPIELASITEVGALHFKRAQVLGYEGKALAQLAFVSEDGTPYALCIYHSGASENKGEVRTKDMFGMKAAVWTKDGYEYLLVGGSDGTIISDAAIEFSIRL